MITYANMQEFKKKKKKHVFSLFILELMTNLRGKGTIYQNIKLYIICIYKFKKKKKGYSDVTYYICSSCSLEFLS